MRLLRATTRLTLLLLITGVLSLSLIAGKITLIPFRHASLFWRNLHFRTWAKLLARLLSIRINSPAKAPDRPFLLVANHLSYIDVIVLASQVDCAFVAKSEVATWPIIGWLSRAADTVFINRRQHRDLRRAMNDVEELIKRGLGVVLFAEGTSTCGQHVAPFKSSMLQLAAEKQIPVYHASISYSTRLAEASVDQAVCWWGEMTFSDHFFRLLKLSEFDALVRFGSEPIVSTNRRVLAAKLWQAVNAQFIPVSAN